jgi:MYXO-CTERM domain-containing protein
MTSSITCSGCDSAVLLLLGLLLLLLLARRHPGQLCMPRCSSLC